MVKSVVVDDCFPGAIFSLCIFAYLARVLFSLRFSLKNNRVLLSGIQPTNAITLGNYLGALKNWTQLQDSYRCYFAVVDLHSLVTCQHQADSSIADNTWYALATYLATGIDPERACLFAQSQVAQHSQLAWILNCFSYMGELTRMTQFKDKSKDKTNIPAGLFNYPTLMAADILLYQAELVPVGEDQRQHLELTRNLAQRVNKALGSQLFTVPEPYIAKLGARVMDLRNPLIKMSKTTENPQGTIFLNDSNEQIAKKIARAITDSGKEIVFDQQTKPGISNLLVIQAVIEGQSIDTVVNRYQHSNYGKLKSDTAEIVIAELQPVRDKIKQLLAERQYLQQVLTAGGQQARQTAQMTLAHVHQVLGIVTNQGGLRD